MLLRVEEPIAHLDHRRGRATVSDEDQRRKVHPEDARTLVDLLLREGTDDALAAATAIETGLAERADVDLSNAGLQAVWIVLADYPPEGHLAQLTDYVAHAM